MVSGPAPLAPGRPVGRADRGRLSRRVAVALSAATFLVHALAAAALIVCVLTFRLDRLM
jgi:hypothetical protein